jgi:VIT1/CCC1 family predicted Fe2+/Mn2+ transporter
MLLDPKFIKPLVFGGLDGLTTTLALVWGSIAVGEERVSPIAAFVLGIANLLATGISMGIGDYVGTLAELEASKGKMDSQEVRLGALRSGLTMFCSFIGFGSIPLMAFLPAFGTLLLRRTVSTILCLISLLFLGYIRGIVTNSGKFRSAFTMLSLGSGAAGVSFGASKLIFGWLVGGEVEGV